MKEPQIQELYNEKTKTFVITYLFEIEITKDNEGKSSLKTNAPPGVSLFDEITKYMEKDVSKGIDDILMELVK